MPIWGHGGKRIYCRQSVSQASHCGTRQPLCQPVGEPVVQRELSPLRIRLELSFLVGRDRPGYAKLPGKQAILCGAPVCPWYAAGWCLAGSL